MTLTGDDSAERKEHNEALEAMIAAIATALQSDWIGDDLIDGLFQVGMLASEAGDEFSDFAASCLTVAESLAANCAHMSAGLASPAQRDQVQKISGLLTQALAAVTSEPGLERLAALRHWAEQMQVLGAAPVEALDTAELDELDSFRPFFVDTVAREDPLPADAQPLNTLPEVPSDGLQDADPALIAMLLAELVAVEEQVEQSLALMRLMVGAQRSDELIELTELFVRLATACGDVRLHALARSLADWVPRLNRTLIGCGDGDLSWASDALGRLMAALRAYGQEPDSIDTALALAEVLIEPVWLEGEKAPDVESICLDLMRVRLVAGGGASVAPARATAASAADVSLTPPEGINAELLDGLLQELPVQTSAFTAAIGNLAGGHGSLNDIEVAQRAAHTLKGAANTVGIPGIANLTHHLEDILMALGGAERLPDAGMADLLIEAGDCLEDMNEAMLGLAPAPTDRLQILQRVLDAANRIDQHGLDAVLPASMPAPQAAPAEPAATSMAAASVAAHASPPATEGDAAEATQMVRVPSELLADLLRRVSETMISTGRLRDQLTRALDQSTGLRRQNQTVQDLLSELENIVDIRGLGMAKAGSAAPEIVRPGHRWSRAEVAEWLVHDAPSDSLIGLDLGI